MAFMNQELKKQLAPGIKLVCEKYGVRATLSVRNYAALVLTLWEGPFDFGRTSGNMNLYGLREMDLSEDALAFLEEVDAAMNIGNHDNSDIMSDYFDVGWYTDIHLGNRLKPYRILRNELA